MCWRLPARTLARQRDRVDESCVRACVRAGVPYAPSRVDAAILLPSNTLVCVEPQSAHGAAILQRYPAASLARRDTEQEAPAASAVHVRQEGRLQTCSLLQGNRLAVVRGTAGILYTRDVVIDSIDIKRWSNLLIDSIEIKR